MTTSVNSAELKDIRTISVDKDLPKQERIAEYIRQIGDPYHYRCGKFTVTNVYAHGGPSLEDCLRSLLA